ncbi:MAG TPA: late competence development ComFB family protein [Bacillota bacterium]|nr:late competence development ComFB family protein [Bacillota bacterium]
MSDKTFVVNYLEVAVKEILGQVYDSFKKENNGFCECPSCRNKAIALALNSLQPCYVTDEAECMLARSRFDSISERAKLIAVVMDSVREISMKPAHAEALPPVKKSAAGCAIA